jgi:hypothetical protein
MVAVVFHSGYGHTRKQAEAGQSNVDEGPEKGPSVSDLRTAEHLGRRVAEAAARWRAGRTLAEAA